MSKANSPDSGSLNLSLEQEPCTVCEAPSGDCRLFPDKDAPPPKLEEILDVNAVQPVLDSLQKLTGAAFAILDLEGNVLVAAGWQDICTLFHRRDPKSARNCTESDVYLTRNVSQGTCVPYKCKNHLWDVVTPLCVCGWHMGNIFTGQFFYDDEEVDQELFARQADHFQFDRAAYMEALARVPRFSRERVRQLMDFLMKIAGLISVLGLRNLALTRALSAQAAVEKALRESETRFRTLLRHFPLPAAVKNEKDEFVYLNESFISTFGYTLEEIPTMAEWMAQACPDPRHRREAQAAWDAAQVQHENGLEHTDPVELQLTSKGGDSIDVDIFRTKIGDVTLVAFMDVREHKQALKEMLDFMPSALIGMDANGRVVHWNRSAAELFEKPASAVMNQPIFSALPLLDRFSGQLDAIRRDGRMARVENVSVPVGNGERMVDILLYPIIGPRVSGVVIRVDDVTERVRMEEMMIQTEKMVSVGQLAAGMAHELNNPLAGILQNAQVVLRRMSEDDRSNREAAKECDASMEKILCYMRRRRMPDMIESIRLLAARTAGIVGDMMDFSQKSRPGTTPVAPNCLIDSALELFSIDYDLKKMLDERHIRVERDYEPDLPMVFCSDTQLRHALINLIRNAAQALKGEGEPSRPLTITLRTRREDGAVRMEVQDNGPGMEESVRRRAFDPFFTTRPTGEGTGLGLSVAYYIVVNNHHGTLTLESAPGQGCTAVLRLPLHPPGMPESSDLPEP